MSFDAARLHPTLVDAVPFGARWRALAAPADGAVVDVGDVGVRLAMYRRLIEATNPRGALGAHDELHPLWGYAHQLAWQQRSGRLGGPGDRIADTSWWGGCNYGLSVVPYWAAMRAGVVPPLVFDPPPLHFQMAEQSWGRAIIALRDWSTIADLEQLRQEVWRAHLHSIDAGVRKHVTLFHALPRTERQFAGGWVRMVELFAAAAWRTDLVRIVDDGGALPGRALGERDPLDDLPRPERAAARAVIAVAEHNPVRWELELRAWRRLMRGRAERDDAAALLAGVLGRGPDVWATRLRALKALR